MVLGVFDGEDMVDQGNVALSTSRVEFQRILAVSRAENPFEDEPKEKTVWLRPALMCAVRYIERTASGSLRHPVFKGLRNDKLPDECVSI